MCVLVSPLIEMWLGHGYVESIYSILIILLSLLPYLVFVTLKTVIDAVEEKAILTPYLLICLFVIVSLIFISILIGREYYGIPLATTVGIWFLGYLVIRYLNIKFEIKFDYIDSIKILLLNIIIGLNSYFLILNIQIENALLRFITLFVLEIAILFLYFLISLVFNIKISKEILKNLQLILTKIVLKFRKL